MDEILTFWFDEIEPARWWRKDVEFDELVRHRFAVRHAQAAAGECWQWRTSPAGRLAEVIVLDQFSRNLFRDSSLAFACDGMALVLAQEAVAIGADRTLPPTQRGFLYMPYMHSESAAIHRQAVKLFSAPGLEGNLDFELRHQAIIDRFGRYPHRNAALGRQPTAEELAFLQQPGSSF
jgi:uncharacterized protein (DUF924 family)